MHAGLLAGWLLHVCCPCAEGTYALKAHMSCSYTACILTTRICIQQLTPALLLPPQAWA